MLSHWPARLFNSARLETAPPAIRHVDRTWAWPQQCHVCSRWQGERICPSCISRFAAPKPRCHQCAIEVPHGIELCGSCLIEPPAFELTVAAVDYAAPWDALIKRFKFRQQPGLAPALAAPMVAAIRRHDTIVQTPPDLILPVPLAAERLRERGYNQAWELARRVSRQLGLRADAQLLLRTQNTAHQLGLDESARQANLKGAFMVEPLRRKEVSGKRIALVDDVMTTGSTAQQLAQTLKQAGAASVQIWVVARTPKL